MRFCVSLILAVMLAGNAGLSLASETSSPLEVCIGGLDKSRVTELPNAVKEHRDRLPAFVVAGATSHESYVRWSMIEPELRKFDFGFFDTLLAEHEKAGIRWVPFLIAGPAYTLPDWFYRGQDDRGYICLEHNERCDIQSLWSPRLRPHISRVVRAFGSQYNGDKRLESVLLGITGNYGESIYPASFMDWTQDLHGNYHSHPGWWAGDPSAIESWQEYLRKELREISGVNNVFGTTYTAFSDAKPRLPKDWPTSVALQHQTLWYQRSMDDWAKFWMQEAKAALPQTEVYLVVGGHAPNYQGMDISSQAEIAARLGCGLRVTNEADNYGLNFSITRMVASACRLYGTFFSIEPAGLVTEKGIAARIFNSSSSGAKNLHWYDANLFTSAPSEMKWKELRLLAKKRDPIIDVAVFYPRRWMNVRDDTELGPMYEDFGGLRNAFDYDFVDERMILSGKIKPGQYKALVVREDFVEDEVATRALAMMTAMLPPSQVFRFKAGDADAHSTGSAARVAEMAKRVKPQDDFAEKVYFSRFKDGTMLFLNQREEAVDLSKTHPRMIKQSTRVEPFSMVEIAAP